MANIKVKDGDATDKYLSASGAGTDGDPYIPDKSANLFIAGSEAARTNPVPISPGVTGHEMALVLDT